VAAVIDAPALDALACRNKAAEKLIGDAIERGHCYITPPTVATAYHTVWEREGENAAETWLDFATSGQVVLLDARSDKDFLRLVAKAARLAVLPLCSRYAAALARLLDAEVITDLPEFEDLARAGFCRVRWI
jgi:hypothetical protein